MEQDSSGATVTSTAIPIPADNATGKAPRFVCVEYPGIVKNVEKAIDTLGGLNKMSHDHYKTSALELDYHRDNVYSRPANSRRRLGTFLIVKARRRKDEVEGEIFGIVSNIQRFSCMFDFQYLPLRRVPTSSHEQPVYEELLPKLLPTDLNTAVDWLSDVGTGRNPSQPADSDLFLPPFVFSRFNAPSFHVLGRETQPIKPTKGAIAAAASTVPVVGLSLRKERRLQCYLVQGNEPFPTEPHLDAVRFADERCAIPRPHELIKTMFDERPMWSRNAVLVNSELEDHLIKWLLPKFAFYILSGPFGRVWCRFGYDPRKDRSAVAYQTVMINLSKIGLGNAFRIRIGYKVPSTNRLKVTSRGISTARELRTSKLGKNWYIFEDGVLPPFRQIWYQLADIGLPIAEEEIKKALAVENPVFMDGSTSNTDNQGVGWLLPGATDRVREAMKNSLKAALEKMDTSMDRPERMPSDDDESQDDEEDEMANVYFS